MAGNSVDNAKVFPMSKLRDYQNREENVFPVAKAYSSALVESIPTSPYFAKRARATDGTLPFLTFDPEIAGAGNYASDNTLSVKENIASRQAGREVATSRARINAMGKGEELEDFEDSNKEWEYGSMLWEALSTPGYVLRGAIDEGIRTQSIVGALSQGYSELSALWDNNAKARKISTQDWLKEGNILNDSPYAQLALGFIGDVILDPTSFAGGGVAAGSRIGRAITKVGGEAGLKAVQQTQRALRYVDPASLALRGTGKVLGATGRAIAKRESGKAMLSFLEDTFDSTAKLKKTDEGRRVLAHEKAAYALSDEQRLGIAATTERIFANTLPEERIAMGLWADQGREVLEQRFKAMEAKGMLADAGKGTSRVEELMYKYDAFKTEMDAMFKIEAKAGLINPIMFRDAYVHGAPESSKHTARIIKRLRKELGIPEQDARNMRLGTGANRGPTKPATSSYGKHFASMFDRLKSGISTELDASLLYARRGFEHVRTIANATLIDNILNDDALKGSVRLLDDPDLLKSPEALKEYEKMLAMDGKGLIKVRRNAEAITSTDPKTGRLLKSNSGEGSIVQLIEAPKEIADHLNGAERLFVDKGLLGKFFKEVFDPTQSWWKSMAVLSPAYHTRNLMGNIFNAYLGGLSDPRWYHRATQIQSGMRSLNTIGDRVFNRMMHPISGKPKYAPVEGAMTVGQERDLRELLANRFDLKVTKPGTPTRDIHGVPITVQGAESADLYHPTINATIDMVDRVFTAIGRTSGKGPGEAFDNLIYAIKNNDETAMAQLAQIFGWQGGPKNLVGNKFDDAFLGSGEGGKAFGHGHYFSDLEAVANVYKKYHDKPEELVFSENVPFRVAELARHWHSKVGFRDKDEMISYFSSDLGRGIGPNGRDKLVQEALDLVNSGDISIESGGGKVRKVLAAPNPEDFMDWYNPVSEDQKRKLIDYAEKYDGFGADSIRRRFDRMLKNNKAEKFLYYTGTQSSVLPAIEWLDNDISRFSGGYNGVKVKGGIINYLSTHGPEKTAADLREDVDKIAVSWRNELERRQRFYDNSANKMEKQLANLPANDPRTVKLKESIVDAKVRADDIALDLEKGHPNLDEYQRAINEIADDNVVIKERPEIEPTGEAIYSYLSHLMDSGRDTGTRFASEWLDNAGIPGNKMETGGIRASSIKTPGKYNYVVFSDRNIIPEEGFDDAIDTANWPGSTKDFPILTQAGLIRRKPRVPAKPEPTWKLEDFSPPKGTEQEVKSQWMTMAKAEFEKIFPKVDTSKMSPQELEAYDRSVKELIRKYPGSAQRVAREMSDADWERFANRVYDDQARAVRGPLAKDAPKVEPKVEPKPEPVAAKGKKSELKPAVKATDVSPTATRFDNDTMLADVAKAIQRQGPGARDIAIRAWKLVAHDNPNPLSAAHEELLDNYANILRIDPKTGEDLKRAATIDKSLPKFGSQGYVDPTENTTMAQAINPKASEEEIEAYVNRFFDNTDYSRAKAIPLDVFMEGSSVRVPVYHGSLDRFEIVDPTKSEIGFHVSEDPAVASWVSTDKFRSTFPKGTEADPRKHPKVYKLWINLRNPVRLVDKGNWNPGEVAKQLYDKGIFDVNEYGEIADLAENGYFRSAEGQIREILLDKDYDGVVYLNRVEMLKPGADDITKPYSEYFKDADGNPTHKFDVPDEQFLQKYPEAKDSYIVFSPYDVKSAVGNKGTYSRAEINMYKQGIKGTYRQVDPLNDTRAIIGILQGSDVSTLPHELAHVVRKHLPEADRKALNEWVKASGDDWTVDQEEQFARGFERMLYENKMEGMSPALSKTIGTLKKGMMDVYDAIDGSAIDVGVSDKAREVMENVVGKGVKRLDDYIMKDITWRKDWSEEDKKFAGITDNGQPLSGEQVRRLAAKYGIFDSSMWDNEFFESTWARQARMINGRVNKDLHKSRLKALREVSKMDMPKVPEGSLTKASAAPDIATAGDATDIAAARAMAADPDPLNSIGGRFLRGIKMDPRIPKILGGDGSSTLHDINMTIGKGVDQNAKLALFMDQLSKGVSPELAAMHTKKYLGDWSDMSEIEKAVFRRVIPFYSWMRFNIPMHIQAAMLEPGRYKRMMGVVSLPSRMTEDWAPSEEPDYFAEQYAQRMPMMIDGKPVYWTPSLPAMDLNKLGGKDILSSMSPAIKVPIEYASGQNFFQNRETENYPGEVPDAIKGSIIEETMPSWLIRKKTAQAVSSMLPMQDRIGRLATKISEGNTPIAIWNEITGQKLVPVDQQKALRQNNYAKQQIIRAFKRKLKDQQKWQQKRRAVESEDEEE